MIIGFDAKRAFLNTTGLGNYSRTLIQSLAENFPDHSYKLFTPKETQLFPARSFKNVSVFIPETFPSKMFKSAWRSAWMVKDLVRMKVDVFHGLSHEIPKGIQHTSIKTVVTIHDLIHERFPDQYPRFDRKIYSHKFRFACEHAHKIIAISEQTKKDIIEIYDVSPDKIEVIYQSADPAFLNRYSEEKKAEIRKKYQLPDSFLLSVGSIIERKNLLQVIKALAETKDIKLVVIGEGKDYKKKIEEYLAQHHLSDRIIFLNDHFQIPFSDLPVIYQLSNALIYISTYEGFGLPVLEGIMSDIPVITSDVSCLPEAGGKCAFFVNPNQISEIKTMMEKVMFDKQVLHEKHLFYPSHLAGFERNLLARKVEKLYQQIHAI